MIEPNIHVYKSTTAPENQRFIGMLLRGERFLPLLCYGTTHEQAVAKAQSFWQEHLEKGEREAANRKALRERMKKKKSEPTDDDFEFDLD